MRRFGITAGRRVPFGFAGIAVGALALTLLLPAGASAARWRTRVFQASYNATGSFNYSSEGANGDTGCVMNLGGASSYSFDQLWTVKAQFKRLANGGYDSRIEKINHVDGPQAFGHQGASRLKGKQTARLGDCFNEKVNGPDTGVFDCHSGPPTLTAWTNPQMDISRKNDDLVVLARSFIASYLNYTGQDTIPSHGSCAFFNDDWAYGSTMIPGSYTTAKVSLPVSKLAHMDTRETVDKHVGLGENTEFPPQQECAATFGKPRVCVVNGQTLNGTFKWSRVS